MSSEIAVFGAATLEPLHTLKPPQELTKWDQLTFSPDSHLLTGFLHSGDCVISWDLQTGGLLSNIDTKKYGHCKSLSYSGCGTVFGGLFEREIVIFDVFLGTCRAAHSIQKDVYQSIWTLGEYLQFATVESTDSTIWQVGFTSGHPPSKIHSLSIPYDPSSTQLILFPTPSRFALIHQENIHVWDAQHNKVLLQHQSGGHIRSESFSFSSDSCFFAYGGEGTRSYLWKEGSDGYLPHQELESSTERATPLISPDGESVILVDGQMLQLWPTPNSPTSISSFFTEDSTLTESFLIEFLPDESLVAFAQKSSQTVTILNLTSGNPWLVLDTHLEICGLKMTRDKIIVIGNTKIHTWNLPPRDSIVDASRDIHNSLQTTTFEPTAKVHYGSISPDLNYLFCKAKTYVLCELFNAKTGQKLAYCYASGDISGFTQSGNEVWSAFSNGLVDKWQIVGGNGSDAVMLDYIWKDEKPQSEFPWHSPCYEITGEGWIVSSSGKQLLLLPPHWRPDGVIHKKWGGNLLGIWKKTLSAPYILELDM